MMDYLYSFFKENDIYFVLPVLTVSLALMAVALKKRSLMLLMGLLLLVFGYFVYLLGRPNDAVPQAAVASAVSPDAARDVSHAVSPKEGDGAKGKIIDHMEAFSRSLSAFYPSRGQYDGEYAKSAWYWAFHVLAIVYVSGFLMALFGIEFVNRIRSLARRAFGKTLNVFWGYSEEAKTIASGVDEGKGSVVFVMPERRRWTSLCDNEEIHEVGWFGWKWILGKPGAIGWLSSAQRTTSKSPLSSICMVVIEVFSRRTICQTSRIGTFSSFAIMS